MTHDTHTTHGGGAAHDGAGHEHGHGGVMKYWYVFFTLVVLTGASFFTYSPFWPYHDQPQVGWVFMMAVSCTKAMLVMLFFMHLLYEADWKYVLTVPATVMSLLLVLALVPDIGLRSRRYSEEVRAVVASPAEAAQLKELGAELAAEHGEHAEHGEGEHDEQHADESPTEAEHAH